MAAGLLAIGAVCLLSLGTGWWRSWRPVRERPPFISWAPVLGSPWYFVASTVLFWAATVIVFAEGRILRGLACLAASALSAYLSLYRWRGGR